MAVSSEQNPFRTSASPLETAVLELARAVHELPRMPDCANAPGALLVGGYVRDRLLGVTSKDIDVEVYGVTPEDLERLLQTLFPQRVITVGRSFGILKVTLGTYGDLDVAIPRRESKTGPGHKGFEVTGDPCMSLEEASRRRDFTINAISMDPLTGEVVDPYGGRTDLETQTLRAVDPETFIDDPLRIYRALQFAARLNLRTEPSTFELMRTMVQRGDLDELAAERITDELKKLFLKAEKPSVGFTLARELGIVQAYFPELQSLIGTEQEKEWHPEGDVWTHTMLVIDTAARIIRDPARGFTEEEQLQVMIGALCHDLGKPATTRVIEGRIRSLGHEEAGVEPTRTLLSRFMLGEDVERAALASAKNHLNPGMLHKQLEKGQMTQAAYINAVRKLLKRIHPTSWRVFIAISEADFRGRGTTDAKADHYVHGDLMSETILTNHLDEEPTKPLIQGRDLIELGLLPGQRMGEIIAEIEALRDDGKITTREEALEAAKRLVGKST